MRCRAAMHPRREYGSERAQRATLAPACPQLLERVEWLDRLPELYGHHVANEVLDAMPVERFVIRGGAVNELRYLAARPLEWSEIRASAPLETAVRDIEHGGID